MSKTAPKRKSTGTERSRKRLSTLRRDPLGRFGLELDRYLRTIGWTVLVISGPQIRGFEKKGFAS